MVLSEEVLARRASSKESCRPVKKLDTATFDFWPQTRHALRATSHGEKRESVEDYERWTCKVAKDRQIEI
jgi:hypothetical protein